MAESREIMERPLQLPPPGGGRPFAVATAQEGGGHELPFYKYVKLINILGSEAAQAAFRDYGEDDGNGNGYVPYVESQLGEDEELKRFVGHGPSPRTAAPSVSGRDERPQAKTEPEPHPPGEEDDGQTQLQKLWGDEEEERAEEARRSAQPKPGVEAESVPPIAPPTAAAEAGAPAAETLLPPEAVEKLNALNTVTERYAELTAQRRASAVGGIVAPRSRLARVLTAVEFRTRRRGRQLLAECEIAREAYTRALNEYTDAVPGDNAQKVQARLNVMSVFEERVRAHWENLTRSRQEGDIRVQTTADRFRERITRAWLGGSRLHRLGIAAVPVAIGLPLGVVSAGLALPLWATVGLGAVSVVGGSSAGRFLANSVSRYRIAIASVRDQLAHEAQTRKDDIEQMARGREMLPGYVPVTDVYERGTAEQEQANVRRLARMEVVGGATAAVAYGVGYLATRGVFNAVYNAMEPPGSHIQPPGGQPPTPGGNPPTPVPPGAPNPGFNINAYPWTNAYQINPHNPWGVINQAMQQYSSQTGTPYRLASFPNHTIRVEYFAQGLWHQLNQIQQIAFNKFMIGHFAMKAAII